MATTEAPPVQQHLDFIRRSMNDLFQKMLLTPNDANKGNVAIHPFGAINIERQKKEFHGHIQQIGAVCKLYSEWTTTQPEHLKSYLLLVKDQVQRENQLNRLKESLDSCISLAEQYLATKPNADRASALCLQLERIAKDLGLNTYKEEEEEEEGWKLSIYSKRILVDIVINFATGEAKSVNFTHVSVSEETSDPRLSEELTECLRTRRYKQFKDTLQKIRELDVLSEKCDTSENLQSHLQNLGTMIATCFSQMNRPLPHDFQVIERSDGIAFKFVPPLSSFEENGTCQDDSGVYSLETNLEEYPIIPILVTDPNRYDAPIFSATPVGYTILHIKPPLPVAASTLSKLISLVSGGRKSYSNFKQQGVSLEELLSSKFGSKLFQSNIEVFRQHHQYFHCGSTNKGLIIERLAFCSAEQVHEILLILRQQMIFNELFRSCFATEQQVDPTQPNDDCITIEINCQDISNFTATFQSPFNGLMSIEITIGLNSDLTCCLFVDKLDPLFNHLTKATQFFTQALKLSLCIPLSIYNFWSYCTNKITQ